MLTISVWPRRLKEFLLTHPLYKSPNFFVDKIDRLDGDKDKPRYEIGIYVIIDF